MMRKYAVLPAAAAILACGGCMGAAEPVLPETAMQSETQAVNPSGATEAGTVIEVISARDMLECRFYVEQDFQLYDRLSQVYETSGEVLCGVAPHHLAAGHFISGMYRTAAESGRQIDTVVLVAPQHYPGDDRLVTSGSDWITPFGVLEADAEVAEVFAKELDARIDDDMMQYDHSASTHIPFIRYYLPEAKVCCLLVSPNAGRDFPAMYAETAARLSEKKNCLFAFSIDFSHYLSPELADANDRITLDAVLSGNTDEILHFSNNNTDTPLGLSAFVMLAEKLGGSITAADNADTSTVSEIPYSEFAYPEGVTSYFVFLACDG